MQALTDTEIISKHSPCRHASVRVELAIVNKLIETAEAGGYRLVIKEYEDDGEHDYDVKTALFNLDDACVYVVDAEVGLTFGWVRLVFGNGCDLVSDYLVSLEEFLAPVLALADEVDCT
jgi:hypothetical protein